MKRLKKKNYLYIVAGMLASCSCILMVAFPAISLNSAEKGVSLWASSVLPALLPFFICANFMTKVGVPKIIGKVFEKTFRKVFGAPGASAFVFMISITSGYPMGAKLIGDLGRNGDITREEAKQMLTFCSTSGPLFILGTVGASMLESATLGAVIACAHYLGAILNGILYNCLSLNKKNRIDYKVHSKIKKEEPIHLNRHGQNQSILDMFTDSIVSSLKSLGIICGYLVLFTMITDFIFAADLLGIAESPVKSSVAKGIFEMTIGCNSIAQAENTAMLFKCAICAFFISFGGLSILAQSMSMMSGLGISVWYYIKVKLTHGILSFLIVMGLGTCMIDVFSQYSTVTTMAGLGTIGIWDGLRIFYSLLFSTKMIIMIVILFIAMAVIESQLKGGTHESTGDDH